MPVNQPPRKPVAQDAYLFREGTHSRLYDLLGCHPGKDGGAQFAVWAPVSYTHLTLPTIYSV